jgi:hypothetical protein
MTKHAEHAETVVETTLTDTAGETAVVETATAVVAKEPRRKSAFNAEDNTMSVTHPDGVVETFNLGILSDEVTKHLTFLGAWAFIRSTNDLAANFALLVAGELPEKEAKAEKLSPWKLAVAHALVHESNQGNKPMSLDDAIPYVRDMDRKSIEKARLDPSVVFFYNQLVKKTEDAKVSLLDSLTSAAAA